MSNPNKEKDESAGAGGGGRILVCGLLHLRIAQVATITQSGGVRVFLDALASLDLKLSVSQ